MLDLQTTAAREALYHYYAPLIAPNPDLSRRLVSYQADRETPFYRWFKYREGFTAALVAYLLERIHPQPGHLLDPFAGSGAALFAARAAGWQTTGIEVLPVGVHAVAARLAAEEVDRPLFAATVAALEQVQFGDYADPAFALHHIPITQGAFPPETERQLTGYLAYCARHIADLTVQTLARYAAFCVLEEISYTRKDGQYLRWDARSGRSQGQHPFDKGPIQPFDTAIRAKLDQMAADLCDPPGSVGGQLTFDLFSADHPGTPVAGPAPVVHSGSCLELLPTLPGESYDVILTSPPYCNRYDYTRTYALELVYLGAGQSDVSRLRQAMLSCTVENRSKVAQMHALYARLGRPAACEQVEDVFNSLDALQEILGILDAQKARKELNNPKIADLVRNYFYEMGFVIAEMARVLRPGGHVIMVNDNVRYAGEEVPVDLILTLMAEALGLVPVQIWTLPQGKGNSSQQMGAHGRTELRKCVYVWRKG